MDDLKDKCSDEAIRKRIKQLIKKMGITQGQLGAIMEPSAHVSDEDVCKILSGAKVIPRNYARLARIARAGGVSLDWLLTGEESTSRENYTLRDFGEMLSALAFICDTQIDTVHTENGEGVSLTINPIKLIRLPVSLESDTSKKACLEYYSVNDMLINYLQWLPTVFNANNIAGKKRGARSTGIERMKEVNGGVVPVLDGLPTTETACKLLKEGVQALPCITPQEIIEKQINELSDKQQ